MKYALQFAICVAVIAIYSWITVAQPSYAECALYKCNSSDPNCDSIGGRCRQGYRMCCDRMCRHKQAPCDTYTPRNHTNATYSQYVRNLNESDYARHLEDVKRRILAYASARPCWPENKCLNRTTCQPQYQHCANGQCVSLLSGCAMWWENRDYERRQNVTCYPDELCFRDHCKTNYWMCNSGECVHEQVVCRGGTNCEDKSDEEYCEGDCYPPFRCQNNTCKYGFHQCGNGECILQEQVCDTVEDCFDGSDERNCSGSCYPRPACNPDGSCRPGYFRCDGNKCIPDSNLCDQRWNCKDGTDEIREGRGFKCVLGSNFDTCVLPQALVHDLSPKCVDYTDNCVVNGTNFCFTCLDQRLVISNNQRCDGVFDCYDLSDECLCLNSEAEDTCKAICVDDNANSMQSSSLKYDVSKYNPMNCKCPTGRFDCGNGICLNTTQICNGVVECGDSSADEMHCEATSLQTKETIFCPGDVTNSSLVEAVMCDGRPECHDLSDECGGQCNDTALFCNIRNLFNCTTGPFEFLCDQTSLYFDVKAICDGKWTACVPRIDEEETGCPARFYCQSDDAISIDRKLLCDGIPQCDDQSDETNCSDRFYCEGGVPLSVPLSNKMDGKPDCNDFSDECPKEMDEDALSSRRELLGSAGFRATTWIIGILATVGNAAVFFGASKSLINFRQLNQISRINYILLLNLSVADGMMGVYLLTLSIKSIKFSGRYCMYDKAWRTSDTCSGIGGLALAASQASVLVLACLTTLRLYSILNPVKTKRIPMKFPVAALVFSWFVSILLAVLPRSPALADYFVSDVWMPSNFTNLESRNKTSLIAFAQRLAALHPVRKPLPTGANWYELAAYVECNQPEIKAKGFFGYFSDNSVCLPKFFVSVGEAGWGYSAGIIIFDFLAFIYICAAYWTIFRVSSFRRPNKVRTKRITAMQKRVARLVITDFCCWVPICLMSFLQLGGVEIPDSAYAFSAVILLPINSALNPLLYSTTLVSPLERLYRSLFGSKKVSEIAPCPMNSKRSDPNQRNSDDEEYANQPTVETEEKTV